MLRLGVLCALAVGAVLLFPTLVAIPGRLSRACAGWLTPAGSLELLSGAGYVMVFALTLCGGIAARPCLRIACGSLTGSRVLPGGGLTGPALGAVSCSRTTGATARNMPARVVAFVLLTNLPNLIVLATLGILLWTGALEGPHSTILTLVPAAAALALLGGTCVIAARMSPLRADRAAGWWRIAHGAGHSLASGTREATAIIRSANWKLLGTLADYGFDNLALWATLRAFGHSPPLTVVIMAFLVGGLGNALPLPAGIGGTEVGLVASLVLYGAVCAPGAVAVVFAYRVLSTGIPLLIGGLALHRLYWPLLAGRPAGRSPQR